MSLLKNFVWEILIIFMMFPVRIGYKGIEHVEAIERARALAISYTKNSINQLMVNDALYETVQRSDFSNMLRYFKKLPRAQYKMDIQLSEGEGCGGARLAFLEYYSSRNKKVLVCPRFFHKDINRQAGTLIHESAHWIGQHNEEQATAVQIVASLAGADYVTPSKYAEDSRKLRDFYSEIYNLFRPSPPVSRDDIFKVKLYAKFKDELTLAKNTGERFYQLRAAEPQFQNMTCILDLDKWNGSEEIQFDGANSYIAKVGAYRMQRTYTLRTQGSDYIGFTCVAMNSQPMNLETYIYILSLMGEILS